MLKRQEAEWLKEGQAIVVLNDDNKLHQVIVYDIDNYRYMESEWLESGYIFPVRRGGAIEHITHRMADKVWAFAEEAKQAHPDAEFVIYDSDVFYLKGAWKVIYKMIVCTPDFNSEGAALAYIEMLDKGVRKPEYPK